MNCDRIHMLIDTAARNNSTRSRTARIAKARLVGVSHLMGPSLLYNWDLRVPQLIRDVREARLSTG